MCVHRVCTCVGVCTMPVLRVCVGGCYVCACVYTSCKDGTWRPRITVYADQVCCVCVCMCAVFVHGYVLSFLYMSLHVALITGCPGLLSLCPLFLCVSAILVLAAVNLCKHMCVWPPCTCDLCVSSWIVVPGNMCKVRLLPRTKRTN